VLLLAPLGASVLEPDLQQSAARVTRRFEDMRGERTRCELFQIFTFSLDTDFSFAITAAAREMCAR
jgi:hypothetical protein